MHDHSGASLTQIGLLGERQNSNPPSTSGSGHPSSPVGEKVRERLRDLNELIWTTNPKNDTLDHLADFIAQYAQKFFAPTPIQLRLNIPATVPQLRVSSTMRHHLLAVVKESLRNVKHSAASEVRIELALNGWTLSLLISENGRGFDPATVRQGGNGLNNMKQRVEEIGGRFELSSHPGAGTKLRLTANLSCTADAQCSGRDAFHRLPFAPRAAKNGTRWNASLPAIAQPFNAWLRHQR